MNNDAERFWAKVEKTDTCWLWTGTVARNGYGSFWDSSGRYPRAHRFSYELHGGTIPPGMEIDHKCHVLTCVRPDHLRVVTPKQNQENKLGVARNNKSGVRGVHWHNNSKKWRAQLSHCNRLIDVGLFSDLDEAAEAVRLARLALHTHNDEDRALNLAVRPSTHT